MSFKLKLFRLFTNSPPLPHDSISLFCQTLETIYSSWGNNVLLLDMMGENELPDHMLYDRTSMLIVPSSADFYTLIKLSRMS